MVAAMAAFTPYMLNLVACKYQRTLHRLVAHPPTSDFPQKRSQLVVGAVLHEDADGFGLGLAHQHCIMVPTAHPDKRANSCEHAPEGIRVFPGKRKCADTAGAAAAR